MSRVRVIPLIIRLFVHPKPIANRRSAERPIGTMNRTFSARNGYGRRDPRANALGWYEPRPLAWKTGTYTGLWPEDNGEGDAGKNLILLLIVILISGRRVAFHWEIKIRIKIKKLTSGSVHLGASEPVH